MALSTAELSAGSMVLGSEPTHALTVFSLVEVRPPPAPLALFPHPVNKTIRARIKLKNKNNFFIVKISYG
jgi:hypothetical protein